MLSIFSLWSLLCSNIPSEPAYKVYLSRLIRYSKAFGSYHDFQTKASKHLRSQSWLVYDVCVCLRIVMSNTYCVVFFALFFFVLCALCCQFLWTVLFWLPLRYSLTCHGHNSVLLSSVMTDHHIFNIWRGFIKAIACYPIHFIYLWIKNMLKMKYF